VRALGVWKYSRDSLSYAKQNKDGDSVKFKVMSSNGSGGGYQGQIQVTWGLQSSESAL
jgi:hypothetical protein